MAVHDWRRASPATFHDFRSRWITHLSESLNAGLLPAGYYALSEQPAEEAWPDVLALERTDQQSGVTTLVEPGTSGAIAVAEQPPRSG